MQNRPEGGPANMRGTGVSARDQFSPNVAGQTVRRANAKSTRSYP